MQKHFTAIAYILCFLFNAMYENVERISHSAEFVLLRLICCKTFAKIGKKKITL